MPDVVTCDATLSACAKSEQWQSALILLPKLEKQLCVPDVVTCSPTVSTCEKGCGCEPEKSLGFMEVARKQLLAPNTLTYNASSSACQKGEQ